MNREKETKSIQEKLKQIFKINKNNPANIAPNREFVLSDELLRDLRKDAAISIRLKTMKELSEHILNNKLETNGVEKLWSTIQDLFLDNNIENRHAAFQFLQCIIRGQFEKIDIMRAQFFRFIKHHDNPLDLAHRVELLSTLTNNGKEVEHFEEEIGPFLLTWITEVNRVGKMPEYLAILENIIKFNSPHLDEIIMTGYVRHLTMMCCTSNNYNTVIASLQILGTIVAYSILPPACLPQFVGTLCRTVNLRCYCPLSWKTMKNLLGTHMGHSALFTMCHFLEEPTLKNDPDLLRGSVFFIKMALFDQVTFQNICCPPNAVLPSILLAVKCNHSSVDYEIILTIQKLINKYGLDLWEPSWNIILEILYHIVKQIDRNSDEVPLNLITNPLHDVLNMIENWIISGSFHGSKKQFFQLIHEYSKQRPEISVIKLINYQSMSICPTEHGWLQNLYNLITNYFKYDNRTNIRLKVLNVLANIVQLHGEYEEELMDRIVVPHFQNIANDDNIIVRAEVAQLLINWCTNYNSNICKDLLEILEKLLMRPFDKLQDVTTTPEDFIDIKVLIPGMIQMFSKKIHRLPSNHALLIYNMLINFMEMHFNRPEVYRNYHQSRLEVLNCFLRMRANSENRLGYPDNNNKIQYSSYIVVTYQQQQPQQQSQQQQQPPPPSPTMQHGYKITYLNLEVQFRIIMRILKQEKDWEVLKFVLEKLPQFLANKPIILAQYGNSDLNRLLGILCSMLHDKIVLESLTIKVPRLEYQTVVVNALVCFTSYNTNLDQYHQQSLINTLRRCVGIDPRCSRQSINSLTICMIDMRDTMMKLLPEVLLHLSKISASIYIAMPILEFLSSNVGYSGFTDPLSQLPTVYANFVSDQYMAVFAIALPYTNPFKYDNYVVSLAYHVISVWFLKCRLPFRKDFVKFIISGLQTNVLGPIQDLSQFKTINLNQLNQDSSDRKRSSSLTEQSSRSRSIKRDNSTTSSTTTNTSSNSNTTNKPNNSNKTTNTSFIQKTRDKTRLNFYEELNETCIDLMARYTYSPCSPLPTRSPIVEFLLNGGTTKSWMLGNKLITITTSGCTEKVSKRGVCDKCWNVCSNIEDNQIVKYLRSNSDNNNNNDVEKLNRQSSGEKSYSEETTTTTTNSSGSGSDNLTKLLEIDDCGSNKTRQLCSCWCQGWAEIFIRRPTGNVSWIMKIQNSIAFKQLIFDFPLNEISDLYMPDLKQKSDSFSNNNNNNNSNKSEESEAQQLEEMEPNIVPQSPIRKRLLSRQSSHDSDFEYDDDYDDENRIKSRNPVRRSNSSPEMANWKNPFVHQLPQQLPQQQQQQDDVFEEDTIKKKKDIRVSCEAIPEEISNQTINEQQQQQQQQHPSLLSCHSYPGSSPPSIDSKPYKTVPTTPNLPQMEQQQGNQTSFPLSGSCSSEKILDRPNNLPNLANLQPLAGKPPQSPTQTSPRLPRHSTDALPIQKSSSSSKVEKGKLKLMRSQQFDSRLLAEKRDRLHTISVMSTQRNKTTTGGGTSTTTSSSSSSTTTTNQSKKIPKEILKSGLNPSFVFLQLYHSSFFGNNTHEVPLLVHQTSVIERAIKILDCMYPYEVHKIGVLYINYGQQNNEIEILKNTNGSLRYMEFLKKLGTIIRLSDIDPKNVFLGGLQQDGNDGKYMYMHQDDLVMLAFHVGTLMPNRDNDPQATQKKGYIGNDNVVIVYNNSGEEYDITTFKSQVTLAYIIVEPLDYNCHKVEVKVKSDLLKIIGTKESIVVTDESVSIFVRQLAIHADLAATVLNSLRSHATDPYASNWLERLRKLKNIREKVIDEIKRQKEALSGFSDEKVIFEDFTDFT